MGKLMFRDTILFHHIYTVRQLCCAKSFFNEIKSPNKWIFNIFRFKIVIIKFYFGLIGFYFFVLILFPYEAKSVEYFIGIIQLKQNLLLAALVKYLILKWNLNTAKYFSYLMSCSLNIVENR